MFLLPGESTPITSPSDLRAASECEFGLLRGLDARLGRRAAAAVRDDAMVARLADLGLAHEQRYLRELARDRRVVEVERPRQGRAEYAAAHARTLAALAGDADVVYQGFFFDGAFQGYADFLVREADGWVVTDTKLARGPGVPALLQIAAYAAMLEDAGVPVAPVVRLVLGDGAAREFALADVLPAYRARRARLDRIVAEHVTEPVAVAWGDERYLACGSCAECSAELEAARDVALVAGVHRTQRGALRAAGITTIDELAASEGPVAGLPSRILAKVRDQAGLQLAAEADPAGGVLHSVHDTGALRLLPPPSPGDIFFDFEGDPLHHEPGSTVRGLEYLFGVIELDDAGEPRFRAFWAHDRAAEREALVDFLAYVRARRERWPDLHIYHYADYERAALLRLAVRHGVGEEAVDGLLRAGVLVDLYAVVRGSIRVSQRSYSIKKLEPLYMGADLRDGEVTTASDSIVAYEEFADAVIAGQSERAAGLLEQIRAYNEYDCLSTLRLRDWLLARAAEHGIVPGGEVGEPPPPPEPEEEPHELEVALRALVPTERGHVRTADEQAIAMLAATVQYNRRERKPFWWAHFDRLRTPVEEWRRAPDVLVVEAAEVTNGWAQQGRQRKPRRRLRLRGRFDGGSRVGPGSDLISLYDADPAAALVPAPGHGRLKAGTVHVLDRRVEDGVEVLEVEEATFKEIAAHDRLPVALAPTGPLRTDNIDAALAELGMVVVGTGGALPPQPGLDLLRRTPPRTHSGALPLVLGGPDRHIDAVTAAVLDLDHSYLGVQGPPGTGKTHVAAHVIRRLVAEHGWRVGVVAQSHAAVTNVLDAVVAAGLDPTLVGKAPERDDPVVRRGWTVLAKDGLAAFAADRAATGYVVGGTQWDLTNAGRIARDGLDLVVVDEAGQFNLASTVAVSVAAPRLLLLGDPQQLPQVSQGTHPEPVQQSALGWLLGDEPVMPPHLGYFLETTWRMHPRLTEAVSRLSYAGRLRSHESVTRSRSLEGVEPGLHDVPVTHRDNATRSPEESARVVELARDLIGREWSDPTSGVGPRHLTAADLRVVTPYNHQADQIRADLAEAGLADVPVASVDKFQGQEAPVIIVSLAASAPGDVMRGLEFVLGRNRLNVAVSRGQWAAFVVRSDILTDFAPRTTRDLIALGSFLGLLADATVDDRAPELVRG